MAKSLKISFKNDDNLELSAFLERPADTKPYAYAIFAHVFTGNKSLTATRHIARGLTSNGIAVLRFDFTGLGESEGDFADTNFSSNVKDILAAANYLEENYMAPSILIGHSLGGAAVIFASSQLESIKAVATVGAPSDPEHVTHLLRDKIEDIKKLGAAKVNIGGREFMIKKQFLEDLQNKNMFQILKDLKKPIMVLHSPQDTTVEIENAAQIYHAAYHPKSFVSLDGADHMLTNKGDAAYAGDIIANWVMRYIKLPKKKALKTDSSVVASLGSIGYAAEIRAGEHGLIADEAEDAGGEDFGPSPYQYLSVALASCTVMTLQMYARRKKWPLDNVLVHIDYDRRYVEDCQNCADEPRKIDVFNKRIVLEGDLTEGQRVKLLEVAERCPVHKTLNSEVQIKSTKEFA